MKFTGIIAEKLATLIETQGGTIADQITKKVCGLLSDEIPGVVHRLTDTVSKEVGKNIQDKKFSEQMAKNLREKLVAEQGSWFNGFERGLRKIQRSIAGSNSTFNVKYGILKPTIHELLEENLRTLSVPAAEIVELIEKLTAIEVGANTTGKSLDDELYETAAAIIAKSLVGKITPEIFNVAVNAAYEKHRNASKSSNEVPASTTGSEGETVGKPVVDGGNAKRQTARYTKRGRNATYHDSAHGKMYNRTRKYPRKQKSRRKQNNRKSV